MSEEIQITTDSMKDAIRRTIRLRLQELLNHESTLENTTGGLLIMVLQHRDWVRDEMAERANLILKQHMDRFNAEVFKEEGE